MSDLDLIDWHRVARAVLAADFSLRHGADWRQEPSEAAKETAQQCIDEEKDSKRLSANDFTCVGGFWCRIESDKIATYTRESAVRKLEKEDA